MALNVYENCKDYNIVSFLKRSVELYGNHPIAIIKNESDITPISYNEFFSEVVMGAEQIASTVGKGHNIAVCGRFDYSFMLAFFQILFSENIVVSLDIQQPDEVIRRNIRKADVHYYLSEVKQNNALTELAEKIDINTESEDIAEEYAEKTIDPEKTALIIFTSGTETEPKAVALSHKNILSNIFYSMKIIGLENFTYEDRIVSILPTFHMFQLVTGFLTPIGFGVANCFVAKEYELIKSFRIFEPKVLIAVPEVLKSFRKVISVSMNNDPKLLFGKNLNIVVCGGAFCPAELLEWYDSIGIDIQYGYGITECSPVISCSLPDNKIDGSVGIPDDRYCSVSVSEDNEILVKGEGVFQGYWEETALEPYRSDDGWYHTGDIGHIDENGKLFVTGRKKNVLVLENGNNVLPEELEVSVEKYEYVNEALVYIYENHQLEMLGCDVVMNDSFYEDLSEDEQKSFVEKIKNEVNKEQPKYKKLSVIRCVKTPFIRNKVGKILRYKYLTERGRLIE